MEAAGPNKPAGVVDLSHLYISLDVLRRWRQRLQQKQATQSEQSKAIAKFLMASSVLVREAENHDLLMQELQQLLGDVSKSLTTISCDHSNVSGQIFFRGVEIEVQRPDEELVTVEGWKRAAGKIPARAIVRDDSPELKIKRDDAFYHYVETKYSAAQNKFFRCYVQANWLQHVAEVAMTTTAISGHGLTALAAATGASLQVLNVSGCPALDDKGIHSLVNLCSSLKELVVSNCPALTSHGIVYISEFGEKQVQNLTLVDVANDHVPQAIFRALFYALDLKGFSGTIKYVSPRGIQSHQAPKRPADSKPLLLDWCAQNSMSILDLCGMDITARVLSSAFDDRTKWRLDLTDQLINDTLLGKYLAIWGGRLSFLSLDGTFVTEKGMKELKACPQLKALRLCGCRNIINKNEANLNLAPCVAAMPDLESVAVSGSRISGRMLSEHHSLKLVNLEAARTPFSVHAISWLFQFCPSTLKSLSLAGCDFVNLMCIKYIVHLPELETLDLSYVTDLDIQSVSTELLDKNSELTQLRKLKVAGLSGVTPKYCESLADALRSRFGKEVDVDGEDSPFLYPSQERVQTDASPYTRIPPPELQRSQTAPVYEQKNSYSMWHISDVLPSDPVSEPIPLFPRAISGPDLLARASSSNSAVSIIAAAPSFTSFPAMPLPAPTPHEVPPVQSGGLYTTWSPTAFVDDSFPWGPDGDPVSSKVRQMSEHESYMAWDERRNSIHGERRREDDSANRRRGGDGGDDDSGRGHRSRGGGDDDSGRGQRSRGGGDDDSGRGRRTMEEGNGRREDGSRREDMQGGRQRGEESWSQARRNDEVCMHGARNSNRDDVSVHGGVNVHGGRRGGDEGSVFVGRNRGDDGSAHGGRFRGGDDGSVHGGRQSRGSRELALSPSHGSGPASPHDPKRGSVNVLHLGSEMKRGSLNTPNSPLSTDKRGSLNTPNSPLSTDKRGSLNTPLSPGKRGSLNTSFSSQASPHNAISPHGSPTHYSPQQSSSTVLLVSTLKPNQSPPPSPEPHPGKFYGVPGSPTRSPLSPERNKATPPNEYKGSSGAVSPSRGFVLGAVRKEPA